MLLDELKRIVGSKGWSDDASVLEPHLQERRGRIVGATLLMVSPNSTQQVAEIVRVCAQAKVGIVPQGGNTGLCGGAIPDDSGQQVLLSLARLNAIRKIDADDYSITAEAGCILSDIQDAARSVICVYPLSLASEGSCQIGGNLATNAGGINVIRYGTARQQVLGLEVVLADGTIWNGLRSLRKDTAGYDMKQMFIGSEGTLGIITAATLKLFPDAGITGTALAAIPAASNAVKLLASLRELLADRILAFELISDRCLRMVHRNCEGLKAPFSQEHPWFVLLEAAIGNRHSALEEALAESIDAGFVADAIIAKNESESERLWRLRHSIPEAQKMEGASLKHDISVPVGSIGEFLRRGEAIIAERMPDARPVIFGHVGDGNLHFNVAQPRGGDGKAFMEAGTAVSDAIYDLVHELGGSFSAEHGVGIFKKEYLVRYRSATEVQLMRTMKRALDPLNIMNPGKVI